MSHFFTPSRWIRVAILASLALHASAQTIVHVDGRASGANDGTSWANAYTRLDDALDLSTPPVQIWVRAGEYEPATPTIPNDPRSASFVVRPNVALYGGFAGGETALSQRDPNLFGATVLSGDIGLAHNASDNAYHVVTTWGPAVLDGFAVRDGNADVVPEHRGGGVYCTIVAGQGTQLQLANTRFESNHANQGGALFAMLGTVRVLRCEFRHNSANVGGAIFGMTIAIRAFDCVFAHNLASSNGGAVNVTSINVDLLGRPRVQFANSLFHSNSAVRGGAAYLGASAFTSGKAAFVHCTISDNAASDLGGGVFANTAAHVKAVSWIENSIVWRNVAANGAHELFGRQVVRYSDAPANGPGNVYVDPRFVAGTYVLGPGSALVDAASPVLLPPDELDLDRDGLFGEPLPLDLAEQPRVSGLAPDCGAYEK